MNPVRFIRRALIVCGAFGGVAADRTLAAQSLPVTPDTTRIETSSTRPSYLRRLTAVSSPVLVDEPTYRVLLVPAATGATLDGSEAVDSLGRTCTSIHRQSPAPAEYESDAVSIEGARYFVVIALSASATRDECARRWNSTALSIWRALTFGRSGAPDVPPPRALRLLVDGAEVKPARAVARPAFELRDGSWLRMPSQLRYYYPMSAIAPSVTGASRHFSVQVWSTRGGESSFEIANPDVDRLRFDYAAWRLATSNGGDQAVQLIPSGHVSADVRHALDLAASGRTVEGGLRAAELLALTAPTEQTAYERDVAMMLVAEALYQHEDSDDANRFVRAVRERRSCISPPSGASPSLAATIAAVRSRPCERRSTLTTLAAGLVVPGGGHVAQHRPILAALAAVALSSVFVSAYSLDASAKDTYAKYEASRVATETGLLFDQANSQRSAARSRARLGFALWGGDALVAALITSLANHEVSRGRL